MQQGREAPPLIHPKAASHQSIQILVYSLCHCPLALSFHGVEVKIQWGPKRPDKFEAKSFAEWRAKFQSANHRISKILQPASWNSVEVILAPATPETIANIEISSIATSEVRMVTR
jgi:hypothetical protein